MKRSNFAIKVAVGLFFVAVLAYIGVYLYSAIEDPFRTAAATAYTVYDSIDTQGILVRDEILLSSDYSIIYVSADECKKIALGGEVAIAYSSQQDLDRASEIRFLEAQISHLESISEDGAQSPDPAKLNSKLKEDIIALKEAVIGRNLSSLEDLSINLRTLAFSDSGETGNIEQTLSELNTQLYQLGSGSGLGATWIYAPVSGLFTRAVDGYEDISPDQLSELTPGGLAELLGSERTAGEQALGKIICGSKWYYAANLDEQEAKGLSVGGEASLIFGRYYNEKLSMRVESIGVAEDGLCPVVFSCDRAMADTVAMRRQSAEILKAEYSGIKVPRKAVRLDDEGNPCVFVVTGLQAEMKPVDIIYEESDFYLVKNDASSENSLRIGDYLIVSAKNLYDGKVVG